MLQQVKFSSNYNYFFAFFFYYITHANKNAKKIIKFPLFVKKKNIEHFMFYSSNLLYFIHPAALKMLRHIFPVTYYFELISCNPIG